MYYSIDLLANRDLTNKYNTRWEKARRNTGFTKCYDARVAFPSEANGVMAKPPLMRTCYRIFSATTKPAGESEGLAFPILRKFPHFQCNVQGLSKLFTDFALLYRSRR